MKKKTKILLIVVIILTIFSAQVFSPSLARAQTKLNWNNPNQGRSPYKFKVSDYLNPQILMQVVGCTKIVNTISSSITGFIQKKVNEKLAKMAKKQRVAICNTVKTAVAVPLAGLMNVTLSNVQLAQMCQKINIQQTENPDTTAAVEKVANEFKKAVKRRQCFDGIAITLARNQLVAMTRATMNWVTTGFHGDPMYVRNINSFMDNLTGTVLTKEFDMFKNPNGNYNTADYPYARGYARTAVNARSAIENTASSLKQNLTSYLTKGKTIKQFANNFSTGGWSGWLALTQYPQNNPLGFNMKVAQDTANKQATIKKEKADEIKTNGGFLSQRKCVLYARSNKRAITKIADSTAIQIDEKRVADLTRKLALLKKNGGTVGEMINAEGELAQAQIDLDNVQKAAKKARVKMKNIPKNCTKWEVITPGSIIKDKISTYINSPERQVELVKTINDSLNVLFSAFLNKFRLNGLTSLGSVNSNAFTKVSGGFGSNSLVDVNGDKTSSPGNFDMSQPFDLTKDLGNTYYHVRMTDLGSWNAKTNLTKDGNQTLYIDTAPYDLNTGEQVSNVYYTVSTAGDTQLFRNGYSVWNVEDRAYFDGKTWQNWKCFKLNNAKTKCIERQSNPIAKRGILQVQADYTVIARQLLRHLPGIMPKIGELDYCIPGPNPNWQSNSSASVNAFSDFVGGLKTKYTQGGFLKRKYVTIDPPMGDIYNNFKAVFNGTGLWSKVIKTPPYEAIKYLSSSGASPESSEGHTVLGKFAKWVAKLFTGSSSNNNGGGGNGGGKWKGNKNIAEANDKVGNLKNNIMKNYSLFNDKYAKIMEADYGKNSLMQKQFLEKESTPVLTPNPSFLRMSPDGLKITKDMLAYNDSITQEAKDYKEGIIEANLNIYKLKIIGNQVSKIVEAAQNRRALKLAALKLKNTNIKVQAGETIINGDLLYNSGTNADGYPIVMKYTPDLKKDLGIIYTGTANEDIKINTMGKMTKGTISDLTIPVSCLAEENLDYYTSNDLMVDFGGSKNERCNDGIDNDLNGLVDAQDPACKAYYKNNTGNDMNDSGVCRPDPNSVSENLVVMKYTPDLKDSGISSFGIAKIDINKGEIGPIAINNNSNSLVARAQAGENILRGDSVYKIVKNTQTTCESVKQKNTCLNTIATYSNPDNKKDKRNIGCIWIDNLPPGGNGNSNGGNGNSNGGSSSGNGNNGTGTGNGRKLYKAPV